MPEGTCSISDCGKPVKSRGWCRGHYMRWYTYGDPLGSKPRPGFLHPETCSIEGCEGSTRLTGASRGLCTSHYRRQLRYGDPLAGGAFIVPGTEDDRFWAKVDRAGPVSEYRPDLGPCWIWTGATNGKGYGNFNTADGVRGAHRVAFQLEDGPVPDWLHIDHLCRVTMCVRRSHLEAVTPMVNTHRGFSPAALNARRRRCPQGHRYTPENTYRTKEGGRKCRECTLEYVAARYAAMKAAK